MPGPYQVIKFEMLSFDPNWNQAVAAAGFPPVLYTSLVQGATLQVVAESPTGILSTIDFVLAAKAEVIVIDQVVHIPAHCTTQVSGNSIKCG